MSENDTRLFIQYGQDKHGIPSEAVWRVAELIDKRVNDEWHIPADAARRMMEEIVAVACMEYARKTLDENKLLAEHCLRDILYALTAEDAESDRIRNNRAIAWIKEYFDQ